VPADWLAVRGVRFARVAAIAVAALALGVYPWPGAIGLSAQMAAPAALAVLALGCWATGALLASAGSPEPPFTAMHQKLARIAAPHPNSNVTVVGGTSKLKNC